MVRGLPQIQPPKKVCGDCTIGKQHRCPFPQQTTRRATEALHLVHSDICGPINPTSNGNKRYFITFIDDYSRKQWIHFLVEKSKAIITFKRFRTYVENESGKSIKVFELIVGVNSTHTNYLTFVQ